jgi:hypothetical protein
VTTELADPAQAAIPAGRVWRFTTPASRSCTRRAGVRTCVRVRPGRASVVAEGDGRFVMRWRFSYVVTRTRVRHA